MLPQNLVNDMMKTIAESYNDSYTKMFTMGAIFVYSIKQKVYKGDRIKMEGNVIVGKCLTGTWDDATHEITALIGTLAGNKLQIEVRSLSDNQIKIIDL